MNEEIPERPVHVAADERPHPALSKLARACIALARLERQPPAEGADPEPAEVPAPPAAAVEGEV